LRPSLSAKWTHGGLNTETLAQDPWDYVFHITTWNFLPFLLHGSGAAPAWVVDTAFAVWGAGLAALAAVLWAEDDAQARIAELKHFITAK
jgi:hypothetical protein